MSSAVLDILGVPSLIEGSTPLYPGDQIVITFENGTSLDTILWTAYYNSPGDTGPLATPGDFFNFFVTGFYPASYQPPPDDSNKVRSTLAAKKRTNVGFEESLKRRQDDSNSWGNAAYPDPNVTQSDLSTTGDGFLSGYFFTDDSLAVLSIPSFQNTD